MRKPILFYLLVVIAVSLFCVSAMAQTERNQFLDEQGYTPSPETDSEYMEKTAEPEPRTRGGLFDFLPFVGDGPKPVDRERLRPSPRPKESKPVFSREHMDELQMVANQFLLGSEFTKPTVRKDGDGRYYRDYIVFGGEYDARVLRGDTDETPFIGHVQVKGDYFKTGSHNASDEARSDFKFKYDTREFRLVFERVEKWEYSNNPNGEPFTFVKSWEFRRLQSRPIVDLSELEPLPGSVRGTTEEPKTEGQELETLSE